VKNRFQNSPFKCNLQRYTAEGASAVAAAAAFARETSEAAGVAADDALEVRRCTLESS
jgi:hypothetical protein